MKILIIEDEAILAKVLREKFEKEKFNVEVGKDGESAYSLAKKFRPSLILLDLILPKKSGFEVLNELKEDVELKDIPVMVVSNLGEDENIKKALKSGAVDYLVKTQHPINEVVDKVKQYLIDKA